SPKLITYPCARNVTVSHLPAVERGWRSCGRWLLEDYGFRRLVLPDAFKGRMPTNPVAGPCRELHCDHHAGISPYRPAAELPRDGLKGRIAALKLLEPTQQIALYPHRKAGPYSAGKDQLAAFVVADEKGFQIAAGGIRYRPAPNHELLPLNAFRPQPVLP